MIHKHASLDKYDAYFPGKPHFVQDNYYVSQWSGQFHTAQAYAWNSFTDKGRSQGVQKKSWKVSGSGISVDSYHVGKSDNL